MQPTTIGLGLAKHVFQVYGIADGSKVVVRKKLRRSEVLEFFQSCVDGARVARTL